MVVPRTQLNIFSDKAGKSPHIPDVPDNVPAPAVDPDDPRLEEPEKDDVKADMTTLTVKDCRCWLCRSFQWERA